MWSNPITPSMFFLRLELGDGKEERVKERKGREGKGGEVKTVKGEEEMKMLVMSQVRHTLGSYSLSEIRISLGVLYFIWQSYICSSQRLSSFHLSSHLSCTKLQ